ncbi:hypothetical protein [Paenibacillus taichungensis]|uniref:hypothetical protein n=1 Tax=Paenibacillus taichungensis TaxID=484184 RepID=UPI0039A5593D
MNISSAKKGSKVRFCHRGGWDGEYERAAKILKHNGEYVVERVDIYQSSTDVFLQGFKESFNSVFFEDVYGNEDGVDYAQIRKLTNVPFTEFVRERVKSATFLREMEHSFISVDDFGCDPNDPEADEPDSPVVVVDVKVRGALYTFWFNTETDLYDYTILGEDAVTRYLTISKGERPEFPGIYTYESE